MSEQSNTDARKPGTATISPMPQAPRIHSVAHQAGLLREAIQSEKGRLAFFLGAGCPLGICEKDDKTRSNLIPDVDGLTRHVEELLKKDQDLHDAWIRLKEMCGQPLGKPPNLEHILTQLRTICELRGAPDVGGMKKCDLQLLDAEICRAIAEVVGQPLPGHHTCYHRFAGWLSQVERIKPIEVFTPNYDLLVEEALECFRVPFFDGFVGTREPFFDTTAIEQDTIPSRWARVWKLHGSINWIKEDDARVFRSYPPRKGQQLLIYPSHLKYKQSRRMPYLAMFDRLRAFFTDPNSVLIICGYSFGDEHLNEVILDGLRGNRSSHCFALLYSEIANHTLVVSMAQKHSNLTVLARDGAIIGRRKGAYKKIDPESVHDGCGFAISHPSGSANNDEETNTHCLLGDFHQFGLFLETEFGVSHANE